MLDQWVYAFSVLINLAKILLSIEVSATLYSNKA